MKEVHTKIVIDFNFNDRGVTVKSNCNLKGLNHLQKSFVILISDRIRDVIEDTDFKNETRCNETRCRDLDKLDNMLDDLIDDLFKRLEKRR